MSVTKVRAKKLFPEANVMRRSWSYVVRRGTFMEGALSGVDILASGVLPLGSVTVRTHTEEHAEEIGRLWAAARDMRDALHQAETALAIAGSYRAPDQDRILAALSAARAALALARGEQP